MSHSLYTINKGINRDIEFRGLRGPYIGYLGGVITLHLLGFALAYVAGMNLYLCVVLTAGSGTLVTTRIYALSKKYGAFGLMKKQARRKVPDLITCRSRRVFTAPNYSPQIANHDQAT